LTNNCLFGVDNPTPKLLS